jgi:PAS domain S-box-containing protein
MLKALPGAIYTTDSEGRITFYNEAAVSLWGVRPRLNENEWCGSWHLYWPDGRPMARDECPMAIALKQGRPINGAEAVAERPDGTRVSFLAYPTPLRDELGRLLGAVNMLVDITERKRAEHLAARLASIVESSDDAIISKDLGGIITTWNRGAQRLFGYTAEEIIGQPVTILIPEDRIDEEPAIISRIRRGEHVDHYETVRRRKDGSLVDISLTVSPIKDSSGRIIGASKIGRDITERKRNQVEQDLLLGEMSHRIKNLFAVTNGLVALSARTARTPTEMAEALKARIGALSRAHALTRIGLIDTSEGPPDTTLHALIEAIFAPYLDAQVSERLVISGCDFTIRASVITSFALLLHELATNAVKHGALSVPQGHIRIGCSAENDALQLQWQEHGGPPIKDPPSHKGFGSALAQRTVTGQFGGELSEDWRMEGLVINLTMPLKNLAQE